MIVIKFGVDYMGKERPVNLALNTIAFPVTAIASILHRASAVIFWFGLVAYLPFVFYSLQSEQYFNHLQTILAESFIAQFLVWGFLTAMGYYACGSIKHLIQEAGYFESFAGGKLISNLAIGLGIVFSIAVGIWLWV